MFCFSSKNVLKFRFDGYIFFEKAKIICHVERSRFVGNGEENAAAEGSFQSKPPEYTAVAKPFPKEICEPARRKILDQAKSLSKKRLVGCWGKAPRSYSLKAKIICHVKRSAT